MKKWIETLYLKSPTFLKSILISSFAKKNHRARRQGDYHKYVQRFIDLYTAPIGELEEFQVSELRRLLSESLKYSYFYKNRIGPFEREIASLSSKNQAEELLSKLPLLTKLDIRNDLKQILNTHRPADHRSFTSGTSGSPMVVYYDNDSIQRSFALWTRFHYIMGLPNVFRSIRLSGRIIVDPRNSSGPFWVYNNHEKQLLMSTYHLTDENIPAYISQIEKFKPDLIDGYPSAVYIIAKYIDRHSISLKHVPVAIATTAETLYEHHRVLIEKVFRCKVHNQYASSEGGAFITECCEGRLHQNLDSGYFEFLKPNTSVRAVNGELAELVITSFRQWKTPLIRYRTGDIVQLCASANELCACGSSMPTLEKVIGREDDILFSKEKGYVGRMDPAYKGVQGIVKSQIIQKDLNTFQVLQEVDSIYSSKSEALLLKNLHDRLGESVQISITTVDKIPLGANGKFKAVKREVELPQL